MVWPADKSNPAPGDFPPKRQHPARSRVNRRAVWMFVRISAARARTFRIPYKTRCSWSVWRSPPREDGYYGMAHKGRGPTTRNRRGETSARGASAESRYGQPSFKSL